jgi:hypothetical protein
VKKFIKELREEVLPLAEKSIARPFTREERVISGFSMGGVTTWYAFLEALDLFYWFLPLSGDCWVCGETGGGKYPEETAAELAKQGIDATIINPRFATGIDSEVLEGLRADHQVVVTLENGVIDGGFGEKIARFYGNTDMRVLVKGLKKEFYDKVPYGELMERNRLTPKQIVEDVLAALK